MAIIAPLSVQYSKGGMNVLQFSKAPMRSSSDLNKELAETPPAMVTVVILFALQAFTSFLKSVRMITDWYEAQISFKFFSMNYGSPTVSFCKK